MTATVRVVTPSDEQRHRPTPDPSWEESWSFDFVADGGALAAYARLTLRPAERTAWWWSAVTGADRQLVLVREHDITLPAPGSFEIRASGLWAEPVCETPLEHWSLGLEAFAVGLDDPAEAYAAERGDPVPLGFDLEWEDQGPPTEDPTAAGYRVAAAVHGEVLVGRERLAVADATGAREHLWGPRRWWDADPGAGASDPDVVAVAVDLDGRGLVAGGTATLASASGETVPLHPVAHAPLQVPAADGRVSRLARAVCRIGDGRWTWVERLGPAQPA